MCLQGRIELLGDASMSDSLRISVSNSLANSEWKNFISKLEIAEEEFVQGRPAPLWSRSDDVTLCGGFWWCRTWMEQCKKSAFLGQREIHGGNSQQRGNKQLRWD